MIDRAIQWGTPLILAGLYCLFFGYQLWKTIHYPVGDETDVVWASILMMPWSLFPFARLLNLEGTRSQAFTLSWVSLGLNTLSLFLITLWIFRRIGRVK